MITSPLLNNVAYVEQW